MKTDNRFEEIDRGAAKPVVSCEVDGTRFFITPNNVATDRPERAKVFRCSHDATLGALAANEEYSRIPFGHGFHWMPGFLVEGVFVP